MISELYRVKKANLKGHLSDSICNHSWNDGTMNNEQLLAFSQDVRQGGKWVWLKKDMKNSWRWKHSASRLQPLQCYHEGMLGEAFMRSWAFYFATTGDEIISKWNQHIVKKFSYNKKKKNSCKRHDLISLQLWNEK